uniref:2-Hacid_dh_C domain-containing protein n=1 Tax=Rhabditophanes sp. KR3021 TaxID=114890 RepID=A0AC35TK55_9BILA
MADDSSTATLNYLTPQLDIFSLLNRATKGMMPNETAEEGMFNTRSPTALTTSSNSPGNCSPTTSHANTSGSSASLDASTTKASTPMIGVPVAVCSGGTPGNRPRFTPITPVYVPTGHGRQVLIYDSKSHVGHRREFSYKTQFTNQAGCTTVYYRCLGCRTLRRHLQNMLPAESLPAVPCIAVKNGVLINDPDYPEAADHFCQPPTISQSDERFKTGKRRNTMRNRLKKSTLEHHINLAQFNTSISPDVDDKTRLREILKNLNTNFYSTPSTGFDGNTDASENTLASPVTTALPTLTTPAARVEVEEPKIDNSPPMNIFQSAGLTDPSAVPAFNMNFFESLNAGNSSNLFANAFSSPLFAQMFNNSITPSTPSNVDSLLEKVESSKKQRSSPVVKIEHEVKANGESENDRQMEELRCVPTMKNFTSEILLRYIKNSYEVPEDEQTSRRMADFICSLILSLSNNMYYMINNVKNRNWDQTEVNQDSLHGKVLGIVGLGRCTTELVSRMKVFGMRIIGFDPINQMEESLRKTINIMPLNELLPLSDYLLINVPLISQTLNLFNKDLFYKCKKSVRLICTSPRGVINEPHLINVLEKTTIIERVGLTVEPMDCTIPEKLLKNDKVVATANPFIKNDRANSCISLIESVCALNNGSGFFEKSANINGIVLDDVKEGYIRCVIQLAQIYSKLNLNTKEFHIKFPAALLPLQNALRAACVVGIMHSESMLGQNLAITEALSNNMGIKIKLIPSPVTEFEIFSNSTSITGYPTPAGTIVSSFNKSKLPVPVIANGSFAINLNCEDSFAAENIGMLPRLTAEYPIIGGGKILLFPELTREEKMVLELKYTVVEF